MKNNMVNTDLDNEIENKLNNLYNSNENINKKVYEKVINNSKRKKYSFKTLSSIAAACVLLLGFSQTSLAGDIYSSIKVFFLPSENSFVVDSMDVTKIDMPDNLKGMIFTADNKEVLVLEKAYEGVYFSKDGKPITDIDFEKGIVYTEERIADFDSEFKSENLDKLFVRDSISGKTTFKPLFLLSDKYILQEVSIYTGSVENPSDYIDFTYVDMDGNKIYVQQRKINEETISSGGAEMVEEVEFNGVKVILMGRDGAWRSISFDMDDVNYFISRRNSTVEDFEELFLDLTNGD